MNVYIKQNTLIAKVAAKFLKEERMAVTIGNTIYLHNCNSDYFLSNKTWLVHEIIHVHQYKRSGKILFLMQYILQSIKNGYYNNKFEVEARAKENDFYVLNETQITII